MEEMLYELVSVKPNGMPIMKSTREEFKEVVFSIDNVDYENKDNMLSFDYEIESNPENILLEGDLLTRFEDYLREVMHVMVIDAVRNIMDKQENNP